MRQQGADGFVGSFSWLVGMSRGWVVVSQVGGKFVLMEIVLGFKHMDYAVATEIRLICLEMLEVVTHAALH